MTFRIYSFSAFLFLVVLLPAAMLSSCGKDKSLPGSSSLTIVNAFPDGRLLTPVFNISDTLNALDGNTSLVYNDSSSYNQYNGFSGKIPLSIFRPNDTAAGKSIPVFSLSLDLPVGSIHTLFLTGTVAKPDTLFTTDHPPYHPVSDSIVGIRFVNLSPGSGPVSVNIQGRTNGSEVASLSYKGITAFANYPATASVNNYVFEFRDVASGVLLAAYAMSGVGVNTGTNNWRYHNYTIVLDGVPGVNPGPYAQTVFRTNNF